VPNRFVAVMHGSENDRYNGFAQTCFHPRDISRETTMHIDGTSLDYFDLSANSFVLFGAWLQNVLLLAGGILLLFMLLFLGFFFFRYGSLWFQAYMSRADVTISSLIRMHFTRVDPKIIVTSKIMAAQAGMDINRRSGISTRRLEAHYLAGGNCQRVINAIIAAHRANIPLDFDQASAIDLAGRDVLDAVQTSVYPKVIDCPDPRRSGKATLSAICKSGVELRVRARVTVRTNLSQLIGGATEETIIARVGESMISSIGSADSHTAVLENPDLITRAVLSRGLDAQTAFEIVSIDIADIDVGENIGARLQADQAAADTRVAQALAESRKAQAIAEEQLQKARVTENRSRLVLAEAEIPKAMADAFRMGRISGGNGAPGEGDRDDTQVGI
jgi:uncharacterized protein YqfA (UPF0365 family)